MNHTFRIIIGCVLLSACATIGGSDVYLVTKDADGTTADRLVGSGAAALGDTVASAIESAIGGAFASGSGRCYAREAGTYVEVSREETPTEIIVVVTSFSCDGNGNMIDFDIQTVIVKKPAAEAPKDGQKGGD